MPFLRFSRDKRGYEHFYIAQPSGRRGKSRSRILYWFRTPPNVRVGREPFNEAVRRELEAQYPDVAFDWRRLMETPIPAPDVERWREQRRAERAAKIAARAEATEEIEEPSTEAAGETPDVEDETILAPPALDQAVQTSEALVADSGPAANDRAESSQGFGPGPEPPVHRRRRRRRGRRRRPPVVESAGTPRSQQPAETTEPLELGDRRAIVESGKPSEPFEAPEPRDPPAREEEL